MEYSEWKPVRAEAMGRALWHCEIVHPDQGGWTGRIKNDGHFKRGFQHIGGKEVLFQNRQKTTQPRNTQRSGYSLE